MRVPPDQSTHVGQPPQDLAVRASAQELGDAREPRREDERLDPAEDVLEGEQELEQETAVEVHRAGDVAEQDEPDLLALPLAVAQLDDLAAREVRPERAAQIDPAPPLHGTPAAAHPVGEPARDLDRQLQQIVELVGTEGREVLVHQPLGLGRERHAQRVAGFLGLLLAPRIERQGLLLLACLGERLAAWILEGGRGNEPGLIVALRQDTPERLEAPVERRHFLGASHEDGAQAQVELVAIGDVEVIEGANRVGDFDERYRKAGAPEQRGEARDRRGEHRARTLSARRRQERGEPRLRDLGAEALHVVDVLQDAAERLGDQRLVDVVGVERRERLGPVERLGHPRHLREPHLAQGLHELGDLAGEPAVDPRHLARDDPDFLVGRRVVDPEVETAAAERIRQLARAIRGQDDVRRVRSP